jgi:NAD(P)-dependent dehydrogenase (short-subunit alcohol dehydrogenase family)
MVGSPQVVLVTGGSSGIGKAVCETLAAAGHQVHGTSRRPDERPQGWTLLPMDLGDEHSVEAAVAEVLARAGRIDVVVNNAGLGIQGATEDLTPAQAASLLDTNVLGAHRVCRAVLPRMRAQGNGLLINVTSLAANFGLPYRGFYSASKAALERYTETLSMEVRPFGIHAVTLQPGEYKTNIGGKRIRPAESSAPYKKGYERAMELLDGSLHYSRDPAEVGRLVLRIMSMRAPVGTYYAAHGKQRLAVLLKKWLPAGLFQRLMMKEYR